MIRQRIRIRFSKTGDLRLISHRDLVRVWERVFRRAELQLSMSEGFHPKAKMNFPSALGLGIAGMNEVMEVEIDEPPDVEQLRQRLEPQCPPGLTILELTAPQPGAPKANVANMTYEATAPADRQGAVAAAIEDVMSQTELLYYRDGREKPIDIRADLDALSIGPDGVLRMKIKASRTASVRPREILELVGLADLEHHGCYLSRTEVELQA